MVNSLQRVSVDMEFEKNKELYERLEKIYYDECDGNHSIPISLQIIKEDIILQQKITNTKPLFANLSKAFYDNDRTELKRIIDKIFVEDIGEFEINYLYKYIDSNFELRKLYDYADEGYRFLNSVMHVRKK